MLGYLNNFWFVYAVLAHDYAFIDLFRLLVNFAEVQLPLFFLPLNLLLDVILIDIKSAAHFAFLRSIPLKTQSQTTLNWLTNTVLATCVRLVADVADTTVAAPEVLTYAVLADVWVQGALIDV